MNVVLLYFENVILPLNYTAMWLGLCSARYMDGETSMEEVLRHLNYQGVCLRVCAVPVLGSLSVSIWTSMCCLEILVCE